ncbi:hypothetical protein JCM3765_003189 [Sporobolomyces pararoseus]
MPRALRAGRVPPLAQPIEPDYFESLGSLAEFSTGARVHQPTRTQVSLPSREQEFSTSGRLIVCHDYKGGYSEDDEERGYTFQFWHLCQIYIYFSHHRVSLPPPAVVRTAHRHQTRVYGTLIFEWDAGRADIIELLEPGGKEETCTFDKLDLRYADWLVDLAVERGFDGWLVNVEVELGGLKEESGDRKMAKEHAQLLLHWLTYFKREMRRRIPGSEVTWYDAVTIEGKLHWQNAVNERNVDFLVACDSIFLNYHWSLDKIRSTTSFLKSHPHVTVDWNQICFGIDVFGRGTYGGGGFQSWRALEAIRSVGMEDGQSYSAALFAPGWTVESQDLKHSFETKEDYDKWFRDELYFWSNGSPTPSVTSELARLRKQNQDQAGEHRARRLAQALTRQHHVPIPFRHPIIPINFDLRSIQIPDGNHRSILSFFPSQAPLISDDVYFTNFSSGTGHSFFIEGRQVETSLCGYTDVDYTFPFPHFLYKRPVTGVKASFTQETGEVWEGERSIKLEFDGTADAPLDIVYLDFPLQPDQRWYRAKVVFKFLDYTVNQEEDEEYDPDLVPCPQLFSQEPYETEQQVYHKDTIINFPENLDSWGSATAAFVGNEYTTITKFSLSMKNPRPFILGSISIFPAPTYRGIQPAITDLQYNSSNSSLEWRTGFKPVSKRQLEVDLELNDVHRTVSSFVQYHIFRRQPGPEWKERNLKRDPLLEVSEDEEYLGTTRENRFGVTKRLIRGYEVVVRGVEASGEVGECCIVIE